MNATGNDKLARLVLLAAQAAMAMVGSLSAGEVKPLSGYPKADRLWLGTDEGVVRPSGYQAYSASSEGFLELHVEDGALLKKDDCWATLNPKQLETERRALELAQRRLNIDLTNARRAVREEHAARQMELHELEKQKQVLLEAVRSPDLSAALRQRATEAAGDLEAQMDLAREGATDERFEAELDLRLEELRLQGERQRNQFDIVLRRSRLRAGFDGELRLADGLREKLSEREGRTEPVWMDANQAIATLVNEDHFEVHVPNMTTATGGVPPGKLLVALQDGQSGRLIVANYESSEEKDRAGEILRTYKFRVQENSLEDARKAMGQLNMVHIYRLFDEPVHLVFKQEIAFATPGILEQGGWVAVVRHLWKDAEVLQVGPQSIAIKTRP